MKLYMLSALNALFFVRSECGKDVILKHYDDENKRMNAHGITDRKVFTISEVTEEEANSIRYRSQPIYRYHGGEFDSKER